MTSMKILYVEDEAAHVELTQRTLEDNLQDGFVLYHAESLQGALKLLSSEPDIDLVLTDLRLPDGSGLDLLKKVKELPAPLAVVLVTGQGDQEVAVAALKAGAADYLVKQSDYLHRLPVVISNAVAQNRLLREQAALRAAEVKYQSLVEQISAVVFLDDIDDAETTIYMSPRIEELTGYTSDEWRADPDIWIKSVHPDDRKRITESEAGIHKKGLRFQEEYRLIRRDGRVVWIKEDTSLIRDKDGNPLYWQGILIDVTKEKENEAALQRQLKELTTLHAAATAEAESQSEDEIIEKVIIAISQIYAEVCGILLLDGTGNTLTPHPSYFGADISNWQNGYPITEGITGKSVSTGRIIRTGNVTKEPGYIEIASGAMSELCVPIRVHDRIIGVINVESRLADAFTEHDEGFLTTIASGLGTVLEKLRLYDEIQRRVRELEIINRVSTSLRLAQSIDEMLPILLNEALLLVNSPNGAIWLYDSSSNMLIQRIARGAEAKLAQTVLKPGEGIPGYVFTRGEKYISPELKTDPLLSIGDKESMAPGLSGICVPIQSIVASVGVLIVAIEMNRQITEEINLLTTLAEITGNAIHRAELFEQSREQIHRLTTLRDIDAAIASSTDLRVTLNILMDHTLKHLKTDAVDIMLYHPELQSLTYLSSAGFNTPSPSRPLMRLGEGLAGQVVMKEEIEHITDLRVTNEVKRDPLLTREGFVTYIGIPLIIKGQIKGVFEIFHRVPFAPAPEWMQFLQTLAGQAAIAIDNSQLFDRLQRSNQEVTQAYDTTLEGWARALELRDRETEGHTRRVTELTMQLARYIGIPDEEHINIYRGVLLHDIGKMGVPDQILRKTGSLTDSEWDEMRKHPEYAFNLLAPIPYLRPALDIPYCHHEHWDGSGYPRGLQGEQIPFSARIFSIVDIWDALLSDRPYRKAWPEKKVIEYLKEISGKTLDPKVVVAFLKMISEENDETG